MLIDILKSKGLIKYRQDFLNVIDMPKQSYRKIEVEKVVNFTVEHIRKACKEYDVNVNWIFGLEKEIWLNSKKQNSNKVEGPYNNDTGIADPVVKE
jgi:hypothetical protein